MQLSSPIPSTTTIFRAIKFSDTRIRIWNKANYMKHNRWISHTNFQRNYTQTPPKITWIWQVNKFNDTLNLIRNTFKIAQFINIHTHIKRKDITNYINTNTNTNTINHTHKLHKQIFKCRRVQMNRNQIQ